MLSILSIALFIICYMYICSFRGGLSINLVLFFSYFNLGLFMDLFLLEVPDDDSSKAVA